MAGQALLSEALRASCPQLVDACKAAVRDRSINRHTLYGRYRHFKRQVGYTVMAEKVTFTGNGLNRVGNLRYENIADVQVHLDNDLLTADYEVQAEAGVITFVTAHDDGVVVTINYTFASFTDDEAQELIAEYGLERAVIEALRSILASTAKLRNYKQADTKVDNS